MMPIWLKVAISIFGIMFVVFTRYKIHDPNIFDIIQFVLWYGVAGCLIFLSWAIKC